VTEVRRYLDGRYRYALAALDDPEDPHGGCLYDHDAVRPTGERVDASHFDLPGLFHHRDIVVVSAEHEDPRLRGVEGEVTDVAETGGELFVDVWLGELEQLEPIPERLLSATGRRSPAPQRGWRTSRPINRAAELVGEVSYEVVEELGAYL
jgi:hypothetical protein